MLTVGRDVTTGFVMTKSRRHVAMTRLRSRWGFHYPAAVKRREEGNQVTLQTELLGKKVIEVVLESRAVREILFEVWLCQIQGPTVKSGSKFWGERGRDEGRVVFGEPVDKA